MELAAEDGAECDEAEEPAVVDAESPLTEHIPHRTCGDIENTERILSIKCLKKHQISTDYDHSKYLF